MKENLVVHILSLLFSVHFSIRGYKNVGKIEARMGLSAVVPELRYVHASSSSSLLLLPKE